MRTNLPAGAHKTYTNKYLPSHLTDTIDQEKKVKHSKLAEQLEDVISNPSKINIKLKVRGLTAGPPPRRDIVHNFALCLAMLLVLPCSRKWWMSPTRRCFSRVESMT
jgi:hypothetical protein